MIPPPPPLWKHFRDQRADAIALLAAFRIAGPPVDVFGLALRLGVQVMQVPRPGWCGALDASSGNAHVWLDEGDALVRKRFTLAHELGHLMMHDLSLAYRDTARQVGNLKEIEANRFAADLLMPRWLVIPYYRAANGDVAKLAHLFQVSEAAMGIRVGVVIGGGAG